MNMVQLFVMNMLVVLYVSQGGSRRTQEDVKFEAVICKPTLDEQYGEVPTGLNVGHNFELPVPPRPPALHDREREAPPEHPLRPRAVPPAFLVGPGSDLPHGEARAGQCPKPVPQDAELREMLGPPDPSYHERGHEQDHVPLQRVEPPAPQSRPRLGLSRREPEGRALPEHLLRLRATPPKHRVGPGADLPHGGVSVARPVGAT